MARRINALVVDDSFTMRKLIMTALEQAGLADFVFTEANDGLDALAKYNPDETEIMFVDLHMPRMDGLEFIRKLHALHKRCPPAVMITGESSQEKLKEALHETGVDAFLLKPVDRDRLRQGLKTLVDSIPERTGPWTVPYGDCVPRALQEVLAQACELKLVPVPEDEPARSGSIVCGMVSVVGAVQWSVILGFSLDAARAVASKFARSETRLDDEDMGDAIGELTNIVGGRIKSLLIVQGLKVKVSLPSVISATGLQFLVQHRRKGTADYAHFDSTVGKLWTAVSAGIYAGMVL